MSQHAASTPPPPPLLPVPLLCFSGQRLSSCPCSSQYHHLCYTSQDTLFPRHKARVFFLSCHILDLLLIFPFFFFALSPFPVFGRYAAYPHPPFSHACVTNCCIRFCIRLLWPCHTHTLPASLAGFGFCVVLTVRVSEK